ncbi:MAG: UDP-N-acetylmuramate dehydrogenase [Tannerella sp.]|jgi:UDP-N-acetylmuramate dehydrogenase|nr:UDP-N-acetylmuramate dehydrogenase [Tannerella sp.]
MKIESNYSLLRHNSFGLEVSTSWFIEYNTTDELQRILSDEYFRELRSLHIGAGSNLLFINNFNGIIIHSAIKGISIYDETEQSVFLRVGAGEKWDDTVAYAAEKGWGRIENLSLIPGETGAAAVQNIGAYGVEIKDVIESVEAYNQQTGEQRIFTADECKYSYRNSIFKDEQTDPYIITHVTLRLSKKPVFQLKYGNLHERLADCGTLTPKKVRESVIAIRRSKLPDPQQLGNAGSFFMNPIVSSEVYKQLIIKYPDMPSYPVSDDEIKIPAGWLIEQCGLKGIRDGEVGTYQHQALVIVNYGKATGPEIALFAAQITEQVMERFGIELTPEVRYVG